MSAHTATAAEIEKRIRAALSPTEFMLEDQSHLHAGHAGARSGGGHFYIEVTAEAFNGMTPLARQRKVFEIMGELMDQKIHALSMKCRTPTD